MIEFIFFPINTVQVCVYISFARTCMLVYAQVLPPSGKRWNQTKKYHPAWAGFTSHQPVHSHMHFSSRVDDSLLLLTRDESSP